LGTIDNRKDYLQTWRKCANDELLSYFQVEAPIHRPSFFLFFSLTIKDKTKISLTIKILILFVLYFKNYKRHVVNWNCKHVQHVKIYLPCNFEVNPITHFDRICKLTFFELLPKTCNFTICSIFSNSGHVGWCTASPDTILKLDTLVMVQTKFGFHWSCTFRGEDFWKSLRRTTDGLKREGRTLFLLPKVKVEFLHLFSLQKRFSLCSYHNINANIVVFCWLTGLQWNNTRF
jgi:hypothetical protein